jgi:GTP-binding protein
MIHFPDTVFSLGCTSLEGLPLTGWPEVCFAGRSNVGKSSLLNAITQKSGLARASNTPGRTRELNFFAVGENKGYLVDLPGYGYAKASKTDIKRWNTLTRDYLRGRPSLRRVFLLVDSRHGVKENDRETMKMFDETAVNYQIILTKSDKIKEAELETCLAKAQEEVAKHGAAHPTVLTTSAEKGDGLDTVRYEILSLL